MRIIGCGNRERGDDAVGLFVTDRLREFGVDAKGYSGDPFGLMYLWSSDDDVLLVDTVRTDAPPGAVYLWDALQQHMASSCPISSHGLDVVQAIELARMLHRLPKQLRICGIEGREFSVGTEITKPVQQAGDAVVKAILRECRKASSSGLLQKRDRRSRRGRGHRSGPWLHNRRIYNRRLNLDVVCLGMGGYDENQRDYDEEPCVLLAGELYTIRGAAHAGNRRWSGPCHPGCFYSHTGGRGD